MSELKARWIPTRSGNSLLCYLKSEADKVIALLTDKANYNEYAYKNKKQELVDTCHFYEEELRHHKYKRCLAMAKQCGSSAQLAWDHAFSFDNNQYAKRALFCEKWRDRWMELAEKFKESK